MISIKTFFKFKLEKDIISNILKISIPIFVGELAWAIGSFIYNTYYTKIGTFSIVASQITFSVEEIFIMFSFGFTVVGFSIVAQYIGKSDIEGAIENAKLILKCGRFSSIVFSVLLLFFTWLFVPMVYSDTSTSTIKIVQIALTINGFFQIIKIKNFILGNGVLKSGGRTKNVMIIDIIATSFGVLLAFIYSFVLNWGFWGVLLGKISEEIIRYILMTVTFNRRSWIQTING